MRGWLRLEGAAAFIAGLALYGWLGGPWLVVLPASCFFPTSPRSATCAARASGAFTYNVVHNWALGLAVLGVGLAIDSVPHRDRRSQS